MNYSFHLFLIIGPLKVFGKFLIVNKTYPRKDRNFFHVWQLVTGFSNITVSDDSNVHCGVFSDVTDPSSETLPQVRKILTWAEIYWIYGG